MGVDDVQGLSCCLSQKNNFSGVLLSPSNSLLPSLICEKKIDPISTPLRFCSLTLLAVEPYFIHYSFLFLSGIFVHSLHYITFSASKQDDILF